MASRALRATWLALDQATGFRVWQLVPWPRVQGGASYMTCGVQGKISTWALLKIKSFKIVTAEHYTKCGPFCVTAQVTVPAQVTSERMAWKAPAGGTGGRPQHLRDCEEETKPP